MKFPKRLPLYLVFIVLVAALSFPSMSFAVDPDMQALVIDNGSGMKKRNSDAPAHGKANTPPAHGKRDTSPDGKVNAPGQLKKD